MRIRHRTGETWNPIKARPLTVEPHAIRARTHDGRVGRRSLVGTAMAGRQRSLRFAALVRASDFPTVVMSAIES